MLQSQVLKQNIIGQAALGLLLVFFFVLVCIPVSSMAENAGTKERTLALEAGFIGNNQVYFVDDRQNKIKNTLAFYIRSNGKHAGAVAAKPNKSYFKISFDYGDDPGDLVAETMASSFNLDVKRNYDNSFFSPKKIERGGRLFWELKAKGKVFLLDESNNRIELEFSDMTSNQHEGMANMYIEYGDLPGYANGRLSIPIIKRKASAMQMKYGLYLGDDDIDPGADNLKIDGSIQLQHGVEVNKVSADGSLGGNIDQTIATEKAIKTYVDNRLPHGVIVMWSGEIEDIPSGWVLCDGNNNTPDLRNAFILGYGNRAIHDKGGQESVTLTIEQMPEHSHTGSTGNLSFNEPTFTTEKIYHAWNSSRKYANGVQAVTKNTTINLTPSGKGLAHDNMPPFYVLAYIMKKDD